MFTEKTWDNMNKISLKLVSMYDSVTNFRYLEYAKPFTNVDNPNLERTDLIAQLLLDNNKV